MAAPSARMLAGLPAAAGIGHFALPRQFDAVVPRVLPGSPRTWTQVSGVAELALAAAVAYGRLPLQGPLVCWALRVGRGAGGSADH
jgi:uncharacterized membrane protein